MEPEARQRTAIRAWGRRNASRYDRWVRLLALAGYRKMVACAVDSLGIGSRVLDIGCGTGEVLRLMGRLRPDLAAAGCDLSPEFLVRARALGVPFRLLAAEGRLLPLRDASFDAAVCLGVVNQVLLLDPFLAEMARVVRPGGQIALWVRAGGRFGRAIAGLFERMNPGASFLLRPETEIARSLREAGWSCDAPRPIAGGHLWLGRRSGRAG